MGEWLKAVRQVARAAALAEERERAGLTRDDQEVVPFAYRWEHIQQVVRNGRWLIGELQADADVVLAACWLHDVKKQEPEHARRGAEFARDFLPTTDFPADKIEGVMTAIAAHEGLWRAAEDWTEESGRSFRAAPPLQPIESALLWDADKLAKIGPIAFLHFQPLYLEQFRRRGEVLTTEAIISRNRWWLETLVPRTLASFNTAPARRKAAQLHAALEQFLQGAEESLNLGGDE